MKKLPAICFGLVVAFSMVTSVQADIIGECTLTGYTFMGGGIAYTNDGTGTKDYFLAQPLVFMSDGVNYWGYGWVKFNCLESTPVASAYIVFDLLGVGAMSITPASESNPAILHLYDPGSIDVAGLGDDESLRNQLQENLTADGVEPIATITMTSNGTYSVDITDLYNSWVAGDNHGIVFAAPDEGTGSKYAGFGNADGNAPYISTIPIPEPVSLFVLTSGILWLSVFRRRH